MNTLQFDLNEVVSKEIQEQIESLEQIIQKQQEQLSKLLYKKTELERSVGEVKNFIDLIEPIKSAYLAITPTPETSDSFAKTKQHNQYLFFEDVLKTLFGIYPERKGWYFAGSLATHLAVNFYSNKETVIKLVKLLIDDSAKIVTFITNYRMPFDYTKDEVMNYAISPQYCTNGAVFGIGRYWMEYGAGKQNMPHDLIMQNPFILEDDIFNQIVESIKKGVSNYYYFFRLPEYANISIERIQVLGECLLNINKGHLNYEEIQAFISKNLKHFNEKTLDFFYKMVRPDNHFNTLHWEKFPVSYQKKFLFEKPFNEVFKLLSDYSCKWSEIEKFNFFKEYTAINQVS